MNDILKSLENRNLVEAIALMDELNAKLKGAKFTDEIALLREITNISCIISPRGLMTKNVRKTIGIFSRRHTLYIIMCAGSTISKRRPVCPTLPRIMS